MKLQRKSLIILFLIFSSIHISAQFNVLEKVKKKVKKTVEKNIDKSIDKTVNDAEKEIKSEKKDNKEELPKGNTSSNEENIQSQNESKVWRKYDFVPGDKIIFLDELIGEQVGEFPSKWDLMYGNAEVVKFENRNAIGFMQKRTKINPFMENEEYLPEVFTIEFDVYFYRKYNEAYMLKFEKQSLEINIRPYKVSLKNFVGQPGLGADNVGWHHIAISFNKRALKVYFDQTRVLNIPRLKKKFTSFSISALSYGMKNGDPAIIKNIRVAEGGVKLYDKVLTDGKFITRGILFDVNKSEIKPESMGVINEIIKMMNKHPELNFSIEGHTDSDGEIDNNQNLSEDRAVSVKRMLVKLGISDSRLKAKGFGETVPVNDNNTHVGKANNRRVEFVKMN